MFVVVASHRAGDLSIRQIDFHIGIQGFRFDFARPSSHVFADKRIGTVAHQSPKTRVVEFLPNLQGVFLVTAKNAFLSVKHDHSVNTYS